MPAHVAGKKPIASDARVELYLTNLVENGVHVAQRYTDYLLGTLVDGVVEVHEHNTQPGNEYFQCFIFNPFSFSRRTVEGTVKGWATNPLGFNGSITLTAIN